MQHTIRTIALTALFAVHLAPFTSLTMAQTHVEDYQPGVTAEGATFCLPRTALRITLLIEKETYTPGEFAPYAERFLRLGHVSTEPSVTHRIIGITQTPVGIADPDKVYSVKFNNKTAAVNVRLADDGTLLAINAEAQGQQLPLPFTPAAKTPAVDPRQFMGEEILAAGSIAKMAQLTAQEIYDLRDNHKLLIKGQADFMPKDGQQMKLMLDQLNMQDRALTSLFTGVTERDTTEQVITICPNGETQKELLFRFSTKLGLVDSDDLAGTPFYISVKNLTELPPADLAAAAKKKHAENGLYYNVPGRILTTITAGNDVVSTQEVLAAQFGNVELLSGDLFNKHFGTRLWLNPITGAIDKLEAEQPK